MAEGIRTEEVVWEDIIKLQLDGVMMHVALLEEFSLAKMCGAACMHKHHAEEEFHAYLHILNDYLNMYGKIPDVSNISAPTVKLVGATVKEKMVSGMELYQNWEKSVCSQLKEFYNELSDTQCYVEEILNNVHKELKYINLMENDLLDDKYDELDCWLQKNYGET